MATADAPTPVPGRAADADRDRLLEPLHATNPLFCMYAMHKSRFGRRGEAHTL